MEYDLYHDESQELGYWHGILLIPTSTRERFLEILKVIREEANYPYPINLKGLTSKGKKFNCLRTWAQLGIGALMQYFKNDPFIVSIGRTVYSNTERKVFTSYKKIFRIDSGDKIIGAKFILFKERDSHSKMGNMYPDSASKIETTFRMALKGGIHWLGAENNPIHIKSIHFDGFEHYKRNIDKRRIIDRISGLREYCSFENEIKPDDRSGKHNKKNCQEFDDCQFLQLTDLLVGGFRTILGHAKNDVQKEVVFPIKELINKWKAGYPRMKNSRWFDGFWMGECWIENGRWNFDDFRFKEEKTKKLF